MRGIIEIIADYQIDISKDIDLNKIEIKKLWTVYDEEQLWNSYNKFDTETGQHLPKKEITIDDLILKHHQGIFLEERVHDWSIRNGKLNYYSRVVKQGDKVKILIEYDVLK